MSDPAATSQPTETVLTTGANPTPDPAAEPILGKVEEPKAPEPFDPEKLTLPEGFDKTEAFEGFTNLAKEHGLTGPAAQALVDLHAKHVQATVEKLTAAFAEQQDKWKAAVKADPEIGGDKLEAVRQTFARVAMNPELSDPDFIDALVYTGAGNHPAVVRTLAKWSKALSEGAHVGGNIPARDGQGNTVSRQPTLAEAMYPGGPKGS